MLRYAQHDSAGFHVDCSISTVPFLPRRAAMTAAFIPGVFAPGNSSSVVNGPRHCLSPIASTSKNVSLNAPLTSCWHLRALKHNYLTLYVLSITLWSIHK